MYFDNFPSLTRILTLQLKTFHKGFWEWFGGIWNRKRSITTEATDKDQISFQPLPQMNLNLNFELKKRPLYLPNLGFKYIEIYNFLIKNISVSLHKFTGANISPFCNSYHSMKISLSDTMSICLFAFTYIAYIASTRFFKIQIHRISFLHSGEDNALAYFQCRSVNLSMVEHFWIYHFSHCVTYKKILSLYYICQQIPW